MLKNTLYAIRALLAPGAIALFCGCATSAPTVCQEHCGSAAFAMPDAFGADVTELILESGGNAVDAAVAAALVLAVTYPEAGNIGGGGFMLIRHEGKEYFLDYRETAPGAATRDMYLDDQGKVIDGLSLVGRMAAGVPGTVAGLAEAHRRFGSLPWATLVKPALTLARDGHVVPPSLVRRIENQRDGFAGKTNFDRYFAAAGQQGPFVQAELAATLERIEEHGADGFYAGATADLIAQDMREHGGLITHADLAGYEPIWREPLRAAWRDMTVLSAPPPSSGGFAVLQLLGMKDALADAFDGLTHNSAQYVHLVAEMEKRVFADRAEYFGDPDFYDVPIEQLVAPDYIRRRASQVNTKNISTLESAKPGLEGHQTTHFSIVDRDGNAVSNTYTLNTWFGSGAVVAGAGFLLNNEMDDFSAKPGIPNFYGVVGRDANKIEPGKRMLSSMSPTIVLRNGEIASVVGTPGGSTIFTSVFQAIVNMEDFGMTPAEAASAPRFHHQLLPPDLITYSPNMPLDTSARAALAQRGYRVEPHPWVFGDLQIVRKVDGQWQAGTDARGRGVARVLPARLALP